MNCSRMRLSLNDDDREECIVDKSTKGEKKAKKNDGWEILGIQFLSRWRSVMRSYGKNFKQRKSIGFFFQKNFIKGFNQYSDKILESR